MMAIPKLLGFTVAKTVIFAHIMASLFLLSGTICHLAFSTDNAGK
jgi:hypothetical protein